MMEKNPDIRDLKSSERLKRSNLIVAATFFVMAAGMVGLSFAAVPLYRIFCQVTGYEGTTRRADSASDVIINKVVRVRFDANVSGDLSWEFKPEQNTADVRLGENRLIYYTARNTSDRAVIGMAKFKVMPELAGSYFNKIECFCFTEQKLEAGQKIRMPVDFFVDPDIIKDASAKGITEITLSYTFYPVEASTTNSNVTKSDANTGTGNSGADKKFIR